MVNNNHSCDDAVVNITRVQLGSDCLYTSRQMSCLLIFKLAIFSETLQQALTVVVRWCIMRLV